MRKNYKPLGDFIELVNVRNSDLKDIPLVGLSINKVFIPSIANTIGTNMANYKVIKRNQFAYGPVTSRNGEKITIALFKDYDEALISQAYLPFEIIKPDELLPEYLMMWFSRPEFDRYARYKSHGSARETFDWAEMCEVELPVPSIEEQHKIVSEYQTIENKIKINEQICEKLEATAQAIYREWFVEFNFPDRNGKPYKDNGGKMAWNEELEKDVPEGWKDVSFENLIDISSGKSVLERNVNKTDEYKYPVFGAGGIMGFSKEFLFDEKLLSIGRVGTHGVVQRIDFPCWLSDNTLIIKTHSYEYVYQILLNINYDKINRGGVQGLITQTDIKNMKILLPETSVLNGFEEASSKLFRHYAFSKLQNEKLEEFKSLLLARMVK